MDASSIAIHALETSLDSLDLALTFCISCVVVGLVLEYAPEIAKELKRPFRRAALFEFIGASLVIGGVAGELFVEFRAGSFESQLRTANAGRIAELNKEAQSAKLLGEQLKESSKALERQIADANLRASAADARAAEANLSAERERLARVRLEERLTPRRLSILAFGTLRKTLIDSPARGSVNIHSSPVGDPEPLALAVQIRDAIAGALWPTSTVLQVALDGVPYGLQLSVSDAAPDPPHARVLERALTAAGFRVSFQRSAGVKVGEARLLVGVKPE